MLDDSDDDLPASDAIPYKRTSERAKKARMSAVFSDAEEDEEDAPQLNSFAKRLTKYQKSPSKSKSRGTISFMLTPGIHCYAVCCHRAAPTCPTCLSFSFPIAPSFFPGNLYPHE